MIIDFHSHYLPRIDDGSSSVQMSCEMLRESKRQGIDVCVATPHFYGDRQILAEFLEKRSRSVRELKQALQNSGIETPKLIIGSEVAFFRGISNARGLEQLCIEGTDILLIELPYSVWNTAILEEVEVLSKRFHLILAHLERFMGIRENRKLIEALIELPLDIQINAGSLLHYFRRRKINKLFGNRYLIGSDMHNTSTRPQNLCIGRTKINSNLLHIIDDRGSVLLGGADH